MDKSVGLTTTSIFGYLLLISLFSSFNLSVRLFNYQIVSNFANFIAVARPIPELAPVTTVYLIISPLKFNDCFTTRTSIFHFI